MAMIVTPIWTSGKSLRPILGEHLEIAVALHDDSKEYREPEYLCFTYQQPHQLFFQACRDYVHTFLSSMQSCFSMTQLELQRATNEINSSILTKFPLIKQEELKPALVIEQQRPKKSGRTTLIAQESLQEEFRLFVYIIREGPFMASTRKFAPSMASTREFAVEKHCSTCPICKECFGDGDNDMELMPCGHPFHLHIHCIATWLKIRHVCPLCRDCFTKSEIKQLQKKKGEVDVNDWKKTIIVN